MSFLSWSFSLPWEFCHWWAVLSVLPGVGAAGRLLESDSSRAVMLRTEWCGGLCSVVPSKTSCQMHGKCLDSSVWRCHCMQTSRVTRKHFMQMYTERSPSHSCCTGGLRSPALTLRLWRPWSCVTSSSKPLKGGVLQNQSQSCFVVCDFYGSGKQSEIGHIWRK